MVIGHSEARDRDVGVAQACYKRSGRPSSCRFADAVVPCSCPLPTMVNPTVFFDIAVDGEPLGRVSFEVGWAAVHQGGALGTG